MKTRSRRKSRLARSDKAVKKPTVLTLLGHILTSAFTGEVLWITVPGGALFAYLYVNKVAPTNLLVLLLLYVAQISKQYTALVFDINHRQCTAENHR